MRCLRRLTVNRWLEKRQCCHFGFHQPRYGLFQSPTNSSTKWMTCKQIGSHCIRVDIDDSASTLQKKIREAEQEWVPYIIVVGEKEIESGTLSVRERELKGQQQNMTTEQLITKVLRKSLANHSNLCRFRCICLSDRSSTVDK